MGVTGLIGSNAGEFREAAGAIYHVHLRTGVHRVGHTSKWRW